MGIISIILVVALVACLIMDLCYLIKFTRWKI
jgi:hypothetical protein